MGLVDYDSDSGSSDGEQTTAVASKPAAPPTTTTTTGKKPFQKLVDRANPGRILVSLPSAADERSKDVDAGDERPAKRARVGAGGGRFGGFGSLLPTPKKALSKPAASSSSTSTPSDTAPRPSVQLKTSSEAAFSRQRPEAAAATAGPGDEVPAARQLSLPPPKAPSIPEGQKAAADVKIVGNPLMFMPLSVSRKPGGKKKKPSATATATATTTANTTAATAKTTVPQAEAAPPPKKISLFSIDTSAEEAAAAAAAAAADTADEDAAASGTYQPMFQDTHAAYEETSTDYTQQQTQPAPKTLDSLADDLHLSARERRELFGRGGSGQAVATATFNMDQEYRHNEQLRQSGEAEQKQSHNPVRAIMPGKHSLRQLVTAVQSQRDALEETFAKNRASQRESGSRYGWR